ncbi:MAG: Type pilus assembly protein PilM [Parcubacteria group bacterium]|nr:Type pilus assembly protein PilM [Parcubacteria group bacterium]
MSLFGNLFKTRGTSVLGVDIGSSAIKIVQIRKKNGQAVLETYGELSLGPYGNAVIGQAVQIPPEKIAEALSDLMKEKEVNVTTRVSGLSIPFASSLMTEIELPAVSLKQLGTMVPIEARKYIPVPISEVQLDWSVIPKTDMKPVAEAEKGPPALVDPGKPVPVNIPKLDILVVAIHNDTISKYQTIVTRAELQAKFFEIELFSTMRAIVDEPLRPVMIMDIGAASTKIYVVERGIVKASHTVNRGAQDITKTISQSLGLTVEKAEVAKREFGLTGDKQLADVIKLSLDYIFSEANRALLSYEKKSNRAVGKVYLIGGGAALKGLVDVAKENFKTEVVAGDPFGKLSTPAFLTQVLRETGPEFAVAIGLALRMLVEME